MTALMRKMGRGILMAAVVIFTITMLILAGIGIYNLIAGHIVGLLIILGVTFAISFICLGNSGTRTDSHKVDQYTQDTYNAMRFL